MKFKSVLYDADTLNRSIKRIAHEILENTDNPEKLCLVGIKTRGVPFAERLSECIEKIEGIKEIHHIHIWSMDGQNNFATMHVVTDGDSHKVKHLVREELKEHGISHATLELESTDEHCHEKECRQEHNHSRSCGHHHHHHH